MRRVLIFVVLATAMVAAAFVIARPDPAPELHFDASVPDDLRAVAVEAWDGFLGAHPARVDCIGPINMSAAWELDDRAEYHPTTATLVIRVPGTAPNLTNDLTHEFAHHVEFTCPEHEAIRPNFLAAQGFPASADWFSGTTWETTPSEQYAEATSVVVLGQGGHHDGIVISDEATAVVRRWASES
ncbi:MAG: hypothetical protein WBN35_11185 [Acidimicrobiia bacterium]